ADDVIRDFHVTGVQTCALPILQPHSPAAYARTLQQQAHEFAPFNLLLGDRQQLWYLSNYPHWRCEPLPAGLYGLSNAALNTAWSSEERRVGDQCGASTASGPKR